MSDRVQFAPWVSDQARMLFDGYASQPAPPADLMGQRDHYDAYNQRHLDIALSRYDTDIVAGEIDGITVHTVTPAGGVTRLGTLICLHGGGFMWGSGAGALLEAVPVAATTGMKVVAVNYRLAPENVYPSAVEDVLAVYNVLLRTEKPKNIGIYGCSAGGFLTAQTVSRLIHDALPLPGAIAMFHGTGLEIGGDSVFMAQAVDPNEGGGGVPAVHELPYFSGANLADPLVLPGNHPDVLSQFPPTLLITGTRDFAASSVSVMHRRLLAAGASSQFVNFDGMWHAHHMAVDMPESRETFDIIASFFADRLG